MYNIHYVYKENRFHSKTEPAIRWKGGSKLYFVHGVKVNEKIILHPEKLTKRDWVKEENLEVRRIIQDRMKERFVTEVDGKVIKKNKDPHIGEVIEIDIAPDPEKIARYLHVKDYSTDRMYFLRIPPTINDPVEAQRWSYDIPDLTPKYRT